MASSFQGVDITPANLANGALHSALDPVTNPQTRGYGVTDVTGPADTGSLGTPAATATTATTGGTLVPGAYAYEVASTGAEGEGPVSTEVAITVPAGTNTNTVTLTWPAPSGETGGVDIYGRTALSQLHLAHVPHGTLTWTDDGSITPTGAVPTPSQDVAAGEAEGDQAPQPDDAGAGQPVPVEGATPTEAAL